MAIDETSLSFTCMCTREILDFIIGDYSLPSIKREDESIQIQLPYLKGYQIDDLFQKFELGHPSYSEYGNSRWARMKTLIYELDKVGKAHQLIDYLFSKNRFQSKVNEFANIQSFDNYVADVLTFGIDYINKHLYLSGKELILTERYCYIQDRDNKLIVKCKNTKSINSQYIKSLSDRIIGDLESKNYDSVITKSRTLIEEVLIYIISENKETPTDSGNINRLHQQCKSILNMQQSKEYDKRINGLLSGLEKIIENISNLRNINSDAHGVGNNRIEIKEREAILISNASQIYCDYLLSVHLSHQATKYKE